MKLPLPRLLAAYVAALLTLMAADYFWLGTLMVGFYQSRLGPLLLPVPRLVPALLFYTLYIAGLLYFVILRSPVMNAARRVIGEAALFGVIAYGTYDLSNFATLRIWTADLVFADVVWGGLISAVSAAVAWVVLRLQPPGGRKA